MARRNLVPTTVNGIGFDALIEEQETLSATIPVYPIEDGYPVSDTIILNPKTIQLTLFVTDTPVTWEYLHGTSTSRVEQVWEEIQQTYYGRNLVKVVTPAAIYTNMGITSVSKKRSREIGYAAEIAMTLQKVEITNRKLVAVPAYDLKGGDTQANAGQAAVSATSAKESGSMATESGDSVADSNSSDEKGRSILYGLAAGLNFVD